MRKNCRDRKYKFGENRIRTWIRVEKRALYASYVSKWQQNPVFCKEKGSY
jgi:hypothetical protein